MNDHNRTRSLTGAISDIASVEEFKINERPVLLDEIPQIGAEMKDLIFVDDVEYRHYAVSIKLRNFQEWKSRLTDKNSVHFGISFFI